MPKLVITEEMLDAIEAVKGVRDPQLWDPNCKRYMENQENSKKDVKKTIFINLSFFCYGCCKR